MGAENTKQDMWPNKR